MAPDEIEFHPVTAERWPDLAQLFEESRRTSSGVTPDACWCMVWRQMPVETRRHAPPPPKREALKSFVDAGTPVGIIGYLDGRPAAWCSVAPRATYARTDSFRLVGGCYETPQDTKGSSSEVRVVGTVIPGGGLVVAGAGSETAVQVADEAVGEGA